jgi:hypothetical protein
MTCDSPVCLDDAPEDLRPPRVQPPEVDLGLKAAFEDGRGLLARLKLDGNWTEFASRVLVEGPWNRPEAVTPAWVIDGLERPVPVRYHFD